MGKCHRAKTTLLKWKLSHKLSQQVTAFSAPCIYRAAGSDSTPLRDPVTAYLKPQYELIFYTVSQIRFYFVIGSHKRQLISWMYAVRISVGVDKLHFPVFPYNHRRKGSLSWLRIFSGFPQYPNLYPWTGPQLGPLPLPFAYFPINYWSLSIIQYIVRHSLHTLSYRQRCKIYHQVPYTITWLLG
jgi:hypothetical protein